ncbi:MULTISPECIES: DNA methyltransferase [Stenotrophomonas]|jgi:hypothetical protein|uniref:DNA methyltransferase n=1 Tax=Stenotrophomonas TaxID=40323 RepID=UPI00066E6A53|nr:MULTISPECIES: DNA methyltransferase [Stenotrophomonas]MBA0354953.1 hypothetical protein [Stenotrophomonas maltophilia]MBH1694541.1 hypothetical protein [Stenotrophomonas maltophilia]MDH0551886.1 site-specific DNA-methyltransferase [Stenotrophomonas sp. GD04006]PJL46992.1 hypothetical protein B9Y74_16835 [Stenotrophomonas maltophilia]
MELAPQSAQSHPDLCVSFDEWTRGRKIQSIGSNAGAERLPFQGWHHFKEAFAPEVIARAVNESQREVRSCLDPFGGSGTTALACQFLGVEPTTIEVNPYLADLIEAKLSSYDADDLALDLSRVVRTTNARRRGSLSRFKHLPPTFIESADQERWVFNRNVAERIACHMDAIDELARPAHRRLFKAMLGGMLISVSNVLINGKGRRYRSNWQDREVYPRSVDQLFEERSRQAIDEIHAHRMRRHRGFNVLRGNCIDQLANSSKVDLSVFSPPYPNSFDYTDVYNVELWMLGHLGGWDANRDLRMSTLCSHVQIKRQFAPAPKGSHRLNLVMGQLRRVKGELWSPWIPEMVGGYFHDMNQVMAGLHGRLNEHGEIWAVVGDSRYAGVRIQVANILADLAAPLGFDVVKVEPFRSMRASAQQGGQRELDETLLVLRKNSR